MYNTKIVDELIKDSLIELDAEYVSHLLTLSKEDYHNEQLRVLSLMNYYTALYQELEKIGKLLHPIEVI